MPLPPLVSVPVPEVAYLGFNAMEKYLGLPEWEIKEHIRNRVIPGPKLRRGKTNPTWSQFEAMVCYWILDNTDRFVDVPPPDEAMNPKKTKKKPKSYEGESGENRGETGETPAPEPPRPL